jgi:hypothetical protein
LVEQRTENPCVGGSIPPLATNHHALPAARRIQAQVKKAKKYSQIISALKLALKK